MSKLVIFSDDLTGANDTGVQFAKQGLKTIVLLDADHSLKTISEDVVVMDTQSRALSPDVAYRKVFETARLFTESSRFTVVYKKLDSTLRGNPGGEIDAIMDACCLEVAVVAPAFPTNGRTTVGGHQLLQGVPLESTEIFRDPVAPARTSHIPTLLAQQARRRVGHVGIKNILAGPDSIRKAMNEAVASGISIIVCDAWQEDHLEMIAVASTQLAKPLLWAGSAGLAQHLPAVLGWDRSVEPYEIPKRGEKPVMVIAGSKSGVTRNQVARLRRRSRMAAIEMDPDSLGQTDRASLEIGRCLEAALRALQVGSDIVILLKERDATLPETLAPEMNAPEQSRAASVADALGRLCREIAVRAPLGGLVLTGGDIAWSCGRHLEGTGFRILDEVAPGIPAAVMMGGVCDGLPVITKAGAFGSPDALIEAVLWLKLSTGRGQDGSAEKPCIGITMGDGAGVGPEIVVKALADREIYECCRPFVIGDKVRIERAAAILRANITVRGITHIEEARFGYGVIDVLDLMNLSADLPFSIIDGRAGRAAYEYVAKGVAMAMAGDIDALATAPLHKEALKLGGCSYPGHTEILAALSGTKHYAMMLVSKTLRVIHVSTHVPLRRACDMVKKDRVLQVIKLADEAMRNSGIAAPRIAVAGLNPHVGEGGLFGTEEIEEIVPAIGEARELGLDVSGPVAPDTVFYRTDVKGEFDIVVVMYHDQGHIPLKLHGFEAGVNVTLGLPFIRTSVDHGTAFDIAGQGLADSRSMVEAIRLAANMTGINTRRIK